MIFTTSVDTLEFGVSATSILNLERLALTEKSSDHMVLMSLSFISYSPILVIGESSGLSFLGIIPILPPRHTDAKSDLYASAGTSEGKAQAGEFDS